MAEEKKLLRECNYKDFAGSVLIKKTSRYLLILSNKLDYFGGATVTIKIVAGSEETKEFKLPKALVCYYSRYLDKAFNSEFIEGQTQSITLQTSADTFKQVIQWMYTNQIMLPSSARSNASTVLSRVGSLDSLVGLVSLVPMTEEENSRNIASLIEFFALADELDLLGPFDNVIGTIRENLINKLPSSST